MRFKTRHPDGDNFDGVVVHIGRTFIVLREEIDFEFDGIVLLPKKAIRSVRDGKFESCWNEILQENGALSRMKVPSWVARCETVQDFLRTLQKWSIWPAIEMLFDDGSTALYLGPIESVSDDGFSTKCYDAAGQWENGYSFRWSEIFKVEFDSRYCNHFNRYMRAKTSREQRTAHKARRGKLDKPRKLAQG
jgi:hypothetical protein